MNTATGAVLWKAPLSNSPSGVAVSGNVVYAGIRIPPRIPDDVLDTVFAPVDRVGSQGNARRGRGKGIQ